MNVKVYIREGMLKCRDEEVDDNPLSKTKCQLSSRTCEVLLTRNTLRRNICYYFTVLYCSKYLFSLLQSLLVMTHLPIHTVVIDRYLEDLFTIESIVPVIY